MDKYKLKIILICVGIIVISLSVIYVSYAYFFASVDGEGKDINISTFSEETNIIFNDTSNVTMLNGYTGDSIIKKFSIENISNYDIYYDIILKNVVNSFLNPEDLVYTLVSTDGAYRSTSVMPVDDATLASNIKIKKGETHSYVMEITFLETNTSQNDNMNKTFSSNVDIIPSKVNIGSDLYEEGTLASILVNDLIGSINNIGEDVMDGVYYTNSNIDGNTVYFYRGSNKINNNVVILDKCYKILRTTENTGVKLVYNGIYENGKCTIELENTMYNKSSNYNAYIGYMFGDVSSNNYASEHNNVRNSEIKTNIDKWYMNNAALYKGFIDNNAIYCNNRKTIMIDYNKVSYGKLGYADNNTGYYPLLDREASYDCFNINDRFSVNNGNKSLNYSIGLLTTDELYYAGFKKNSDNKDNFLYINSSYWTMSPAYYNASGAYVYKVNENGRIGEDIVTKEYGMRPVITIKGNTKVSSGDGSLETPYLIN